MIKQNGANNIAVSADGFHIVLRHKDSMGIEANAPWPRLSWDYVARTPKENKVPNRSIPSVPEQSCQGQEMGKKKGLLGRLFGRK